MKKEIVEVVICNKCGIVYASEMEEVEFWQCEVCKKHYCKKTCGKDAIGEALIQIIDHSVTRNICMDCHSSLEKDNVAQNLLKNLLDKTNEAVMNVVRGKK